MSHLDWSWTATLSTEHLSFLTQRVLRSPGLADVRLWVTPSDDVEKPHRVRLVLPSTNPGDSVQVLQQLNELLIKSYIDM